MTKICLPYITQDFRYKMYWGGALKEVKCLPTDFSVNYQNAPLPAHLWKGSIYNTQGQIVAQEGNSVLATRHRFMRGETFWFPSLLGLGALRSDKGEALSRLLLAEVQAAVPFQFETYQKGVQCIRCKRQSIPYYPHQQTSTSYHSSIALPQRSKSFSRFC